ncbi:MAG TPA: hypothetical protein VF678_09420 [bacterium]
MAGPSRGKAMRRTVMIALVLAGALLTAACTRQPEPAVRALISVGDRDRDWGVVYYQSWRQERKASYLELARQHTSHAVVFYLDLQKRLGHSYPDFYDIDKKRVQGCDFLRQMDREALRYQVMLPDTNRDGCFN